MHCTLLAEIANGLRFFHYLSDKQQVERAANKRHMCR